MTLAQLAELLRVSPATVSRALSRPELVAPATRQRILRAVDEHGYRTNGIARSLRKGETKTVGVVVSDLQNPFYSAIAKAIENVLSAHGYSCVVCDADESQSKEQRALKLLGELKVSGIIHGFSGSNLHALRRLGLDGIPIVEIDRVSGTSGADTVVLDNIGGARLAVKHLLELGHRRIGIIAGPQHLTTGVERLHGYRSSLAAAGIEADVGLIEFGDFREASGYMGAHRLLSMSSRPTALFVANNEMMAGALTALHEAGLRLPREMSLVSFDDARWARYVDPPLTVVAQPLEAMGEAAAGLLLQRLAGRTEPVARVFAPRLIVRASTAPPPSGPHAPSAGAGS